jgi:hypothetical protein
MLYDPPLKIQKQFSDIPHEKISREDIQRYYELLEKHYGCFCNDCKFFDLDHGFCGKGLKNREYRMLIGCHETSFMRKNCMSYVFREISSIEVNGMLTKLGRNISNKLDCNFQQYC